MTFEALQQGREPLLHLSYVAKKELERLRQGLLILTQDMKQTHFLSDLAAQHCGQDILRYKETQGNNPSDAQVAKIVQISREVEHKEYGYLSSSREAGEIAFLRRREGDLLFKQGISYNASVDLNQRRDQLQKFFELTQRQIRQEQERSNQRELGVWAFLIP